MSNLRSRLENLEAAHEAQVSDRWYAFMDQFSDSDIDALLEGSADPDLVDHWCKVLELTPPLEVRNELAQLAD